MSSAALYLALLAAFSIWPVTPIAFALRPGGWGGAGRSRAGQWARVLVIVLLAAVAANIFAFGFVKREGHYLYFWDYSRYWKIYIDESAIFQLDPLKATKELASSIRIEDYNAIPVLPLVPAQWIFGSGRIPYILGIVDLLLLPSAFLLAAAAWRMQTGRSIVALAAAAAAIACLHALWVPALRGLPDVLGVGVIALVLCIYFSQPLADQRPVRLVVTGLLLCLLALSRRYYLFWIVGFFPAAAAAEFVRILCAREPTPVIRWLSAQGHAAIVFLVCVSGFVMLSPDVVLRTMTTNYADIYSAYRNNASVFDAVNAAVGYFGATVVVLAAAGLMLLLASRGTRHFAVFLIFQAVTIFLLFTRTQDFGVHHYYLLLPALALGVATLVYALWTGVRSSLLKGGGVAAIFLALIGSSAAVLVPGAGVGGALLPTARFYPLVRGDVDAVNQLLDRLSRLPGGGKIYVLSSSTVLNYSMLQVACKTQGRPQAFCDRILRTHDVDKRDGFPERFLEASYVVLATPVQYHLRPADQQVIGLLAEAVSQRCGVGASLERLPGEYQLDQGVRVQIYARTSPFRAQDVAALRRRFYQIYPALQPSQPG